MQYKTGDGVVKCGENVPMTVESVKDDLVTCIWFEKDADGDYTGDLQRIVLPVYVLEKVK